MTSLVGLESDATEVRESRTSRARLAHLAEPAKVRHVVSYATILSARSGTTSPLKNTLLFCQPVKAKRRVERASAAQSSGRYTVCGELASGGTGTVYLGRVMGAAGFARTVAFKRIHPHLASNPELVSLMIDEASMAACIRHPNVVKTLDVACHGDELLLVMDYVEGETLARLVYTDGEPLSAPHLPTVVALMIDVLTGLHAAHTACSAGGAPLYIVHRELSPHNILVGTDGVARVHDFGNTKTAHHAYTTRPHQIGGKFAYLAPEQIRGSPTDARTDVFAAGVVLWECLARRRLFFEGNERLTLAKILSTDAIGPSAFNPIIPNKLDRVVLKALARQPEHRFATAEDFAEALALVTSRAPQAEVGRWVKKTARRTLAEHARLLGRVQPREASVLSNITSLSVASRSSNVTKIIAGTVRPSNKWSGERELTQRATDSSPAAAPTQAPLEPEPEPKPEHPGPWPALAALAGVAALVASIVFLAVRVKAMDNSAPRQVTESPAASAPSKEIACRPPDCRVAVKPAEVEAPALPKTTTDKAAPGNDGTPGVPVVRLEALANEPNSRGAHDRASGAQLKPVAATQVVGARRGSASKPGANQNRAVDLTGKALVAPDACIVPYSIDESGIRRVRKGCL